MRPMDRRTFIRDSGVATCGMWAVLTPPALAAQAAPPPQRRAVSDSPSLSRQFAKWVSGLRYEQLPPAVIDRAKGLTLQALASVLLGSRLPAGRDAVTFITDEEAGVRT